MSAAVRALNNSRQEFAHATGNSLSVMKSRSASSQPKKRLALYLPLLALAIGALVLRIRLAPKSPGFDASLLRIDETMTAPAPPDPPADDEARLRERLLRLAPAWGVGSAEPPEAIASRAETAMNNGDLISARAILGGLSSRRENATALPKVQQMLGESLLGLMRYNDALQVYRALLRQNPLSASAAIGLSRAYRGLEKNAEAVRALNEAVTTTPASDTQGRLALAAELQQSLQNAQALEMLEALYRTDSGNSAATAAYAFALYNQQRFSEAEQVYAAGLKTAPDDPRLNLDYGKMLGNPLYKRRDVAKAEHYLLRALQLKPGDAGAMERIGSLIAEQDRYRAAIYVYSNLLATVPDSAGARLRLANAYSRIGDAEGAKKQKEFARQLVERDGEEERLSVEASHSPARCDLHLKLARHYLKRGQFSKAYFQLQVAFAHSRGDETPRTELKKLFERMGLPLPPTYQVAPL